MYLAGLAQELEEGHVGWLRVGKRKEKGVFLSLEIAKSPVAATSP